MAKRRFVRRAEDWTEVARWLGVFWPCRCNYRNVASYHCYYCGSRAPAEVRTLVARHLRAAEQVEEAPLPPAPSVPAPSASAPSASGPPPPARSEEALEGAPEDVTGAAAAQGQLVGRR